MIDYGAGDAYIVCDIDEVRMWDWIDVHPVGAGVDNDVDKIRISRISEDYVVKGRLFKR